MNQSRLAILTSLLLAGVLMSIMVQGSSLTDYCSSFTYSTCPTECTKQCISSGCNGEYCTSDCDGPNSCISKTSEVECGNNICEAGEKNMGGDCGPNADPFCLGPPGVILGSCPSDCNESEKTTLDNTGIVCSEGCVTDGGRCIEIGQIHDNKYCGSDGQLHETKEQGAACNDNAECASTKCDQGICLQEKGVWQRIADFFKNLFK